MGLIIHKENEKCPHCGQNTLTFYSYGNIGGTEDSYCSNDQCDYHDLCDCYRCELHFHNCWDNAEIEEYSDSLLAYECAICNQRLSGFIGQFGVIWSCDKCKMDSHFCNCEDEK
jgi:ribosomal protein L37AE/L43A